MAVNEIPQPGFTTTALQRDKEILSSMVGLRQDGGTFMQDATAGPNSDGVLPSGTVVARLADGRFVEYGGGSPASANEKQTITISATGGTFTITAFGATTAAVAFDATGNAVKAALVAAGAVEDEDLKVTKAGSVYTLEFTGKYAETNVAQVTTTPAGLTGGGSSAVVATSVAGNPGATDGSKSAKGVLRSALNVAAADIPGNVVTAGRLKLDQLVGLTDDAVSDLNGRTDTFANTFTF